MDAGRGLEFATATAVAERFVERHAEPPGDGGVPEEHPGAPRDAATRARAERPEQAFLRPSRPGDGG